MGVACTSTGATTTPYSYDSADHLETAGTVYDAFGRTTSQASGATIGYYANDLVRQQTSGTSRQTWNLDAAGRLASWTTESNSGGTWTQTGSKTNHYGSDTDSPDWIQETDSTVTRNVQGIDGDLAAITSATGNTVLQLTDIHGDATVQLPLDTSQAAIAQVYDEYGNPEADTAATRYGWLGGEQRSTETATGTILMGLRLYDPSSGRFLQTDPVPGGSANAYEYCNGDPVNCYDLDGRMAVLALAAVAVEGVSAGTLLAAIGWAAVAAIAALVFWYGLKWAKHKIQVLWKEAKKSGKEKGNDVPDFAKGERRHAHESLDQAVDRVMKKGGFHKPYKKGPTSTYNRVRKYLSRN